MKMLHNVDRVALTVETVGLLSFAPVGASWPHFYKWMLMEIREPVEWFYNSR